MMDRQQCATSTTITVTIALVASTTAQTQYPPFMGIELRPRDARSCRHIDAAIPTTWGGLVNSG